ncbi:nucleotidyltransferase family protein [Roseobacter sp. MH60115]|uniref:nucleotidyltransferase family protein n=1 Tax=Roseobacter sp. MH60115 TaxID=2785324 RepID=UPI0018A32EB3|nr:nucleotidyltransferase family protein [Roseobacter sp. MH60115]
MADCGAIILAAGLSRRMGARNKLLIEIEGIPMIRRVVRVATGICDGSVMVVTGHQREDIEAALAGLPVTFVHNPAFECGQKSSVACGLEAAAEAEATLMMLGDQPLLSPKHLIWLLSQHRAQAPRRITVPVNSAVRGNPLVIPRALKPLLLANPRDPGCRSFTRAHPEHVHCAETADPAFFRDIDTAEDLAGFQRQQELSE